MKGSLEYVDRRTIRAAKKRLQPGVDIWILLKDYTIYESITRDFVMFPNHGNSPVVDYGDEIDDHPLLTDDDAISTIKHERSC